MRCEWVKEFLRKGIALIGREGRTLSPSARGDGVGWGPPPLRGEGCPPGKGAWGSKNSESLSQERTEAIARASTVDKSMLAFDFWRHSNNKQSAGYRLRRPQGSFPLSSPPFTPSLHLPTPRHHPIDHQRLPDDARSSSCCLKLLLGAIARGCCSGHCATRLGVGSGSGGSRTGYRLI